MSNENFINEINRLQCREIIEAFLNEVGRAQSKFPEWPNDTIHAAAIVSEESGELIRAAIQYENEGGELGACQKEAVQTGAVAIRFLLNMPSYLK